ncbi:hypothetical protein BGZ97_010504 [Linnemannia gamsii]|uniref:Uncharacterized protein n=1 Tax=Linnemannia gamsii TaxID=64522 RepID=A0A9P6UNQ8_9FUNG|nr:hypothetical protein BGZ97_010504 [Linnemannia gamsii]
MILNRSLTLGLLCSTLAVSATPQADTTAAPYAPLGGGGGGSQHPRPVQCTNPGFFCKSTIVFASPNTSPNPLYRGGSSGTGSVGGKPGPGALGGNIQADQFICPSSDAYAVRIASCPQGDCQQNYCVGGGPAKVPECLPSGNGLYCGKTLNAQHSDGAGQDTLGAFGGSASAYGGGAGGGGGGGGGGGDGGGGGGGRPPQGEYIRNNLYYFVGSYGVNLGPCPYRCINAGAGTPDYCATSASQY